MNLHGLIDALIAAGLKDRKAAKAYAEKLARIAVKAASIPDAPHLTKARAREEATRIIDAAADLRRAIEGAAITPKLGTIGRIVNGAAVDLEAALAMLTDLRSNAEAVLRATGDDQTVTQLDLPTRGEPPKQVARRVAAAVLHELFLRERNRPLSGNETGVGVQCVGAAFALVGLNDSPKHYVDRWLKVGRMKGSGEEPAPQRIRRNGERIRR